MDLAIRIDVSKKEALPVIDQLLDYLNHGDYLFTFEISKTVKKPHVHAFVEIDESKSLETIQKWIRRQKWYKGKGSYSLVQVQDNNKYLDYISKDMNILKTNMNEERIDELIERAGQIKVDKCKSMISKLFKYVVGDYIEDYEDGLVTILSDVDVLRKCIDFYKINKLLHPTRNQMFQYVQTILSITGNDTSVFVDYYSIFSNK